MTHAVRGSTVQVDCERCGTTFAARRSDRERGWGRFCSKTCKANPAAIQKEAPMTGPNPDTLATLAALLEPAAVAALGTTSALTFEASRAISLKRLADAAERQNDLTAEMFANTRRQQVAQS